MNVLWLANKLYNMKFLTFLSIKECYFINGKYLELVRIIYLLILDSVFPVIDLFFVSVLIYLPPSLPPTWPPSSPMCVYLSVFFCLSNSFSKKNNFVCYLAWWRALCGWFPSLSVTSFVHCYKVYSFWNYRIG